jgi:exosortase C (VPDSG-CTERM-specific)
MASELKKIQPAGGFAESVKEPDGNPMKQVFAKQNRSPDGRSSHLRSFVWATVVLALCFAVPLYDLTRFAAGSELYSYILLIPFISLYLVWLKRHNLPPASKPARGIAAGFFTVGTVALFAYWLVLRPRLKLMVDDYLALMMISFLLFFFGVCGLFWGRNILRALVFPLGFLVFMVPIPAVAISGIDSFLQYGSAAVAQGFFRLSGTPFLQDGLVFQLPDITIQIAPECSGIHSSLVLFITSLLASHLFLRTPWKRAVLVLVVIPLAILRNGFRVFTIGELCIHIGPQMINSPIHRKGGPIFFVLSLIPLFILLVMLQKSERGGGNPNSRTGNTHNQNF